MNKVFEHIIHWNYWRKHNLNSPLYQILVLLGFAKSPTFGEIWTPKESKDFHDGFMKALYDESESEEIDE